ncbi:alpha-1,4-glucan--maltose-1-phosphate maltosyltransferase [Pseudomonas mangrovi]|uniref:Alpha-1,4-glucan:maltose-1-phosphate maltosyltransferase n=2 Tax=Pseudomonas mangrovi TaxID=2161748 RepID=A0A2T5P7P6_9PSED|nr:alpha-1,4-glucan--maltose-1-phosphate maltosyltransferase [Pseudomonas mangrovi]PTU73779.1 alpha-1,4-glucan--maltose-1-phosphate maltosyltransferase [Pseudomonas mangrovi]
MPQQSMRQEDQILALEQALMAPRIAIEDLSPQVENGRFPTKATVGQPLQVSACIFADGHERLGAAVHWKHQDDAQWQQLPLVEMGNDLWQAGLRPTRPGRLLFFVEAWWDAFASYCYELEKKYGAGVPITLELQEGVQLAEAAVTRAPASLQAALQGFLGALADHPEDHDRQVRLWLDPATRVLFEQLEPHLHPTRSAIRQIEVERELAGFASWYELFPRSETDDEARHGTFRDVMRRLPMIRDMGFDVLYFPPIHPIGSKHRKGRNNSLIAGPGDPGSPYAIGSEDGGHDAIHPQLGTREDFRELVRVAAEHGLEIALDFAIQCSPDHPWLSEHPGWFAWRPDGSIRYAENPPKKYQDIVNVDFYAEDARPGLWLALRDVILGWVEEGVTLFRVDNPHTKPLPFWEWLIGEVRSRHPQVIFLSEAFTRPAMMARLGKVGFSQSYTYFTWRNTKQELESYFTELNQPPWRDCYRPNFFVNTPDINPFFLHDSGRAGFLIRAALATMGSGLWGMYSGFELCESAAIGGKEEYLDSEKYQIRPRDYGAPGNIVAEIAQLNRIRRQNPALQSHLGFRAYTAWNDNILFFGKRTEDLSNFILVAVSLDPFNAQEAEFELPLWELGLPDEAMTHGEDLMTGHRWQWHGKRQWMRIEPWHQPFGIWRLTTDAAAHTGA